VVLRKLDALLDRAEQHLADLLEILCGMAGPPGGQQGAGTLGQGAGKRGHHDEGSSSSGDHGEIVPSQPGASSSSFQSQDHRGLVEPDLSEAGSLAEQIQRCLEPLVQGEGTAVLSDARGLLLAGWGPQEAQENLAAVGALAAQMAFRSAEFLGRFEPRSVVLGGHGGEVIGATFFSVEDEHLVLLLSGPGKLHRSAHIRQVLEWVLPLLRGT